MKKRILMMLLAIVMVVGLMPVMSTPASATTGYERNGTLRSGTVYSEWIEEGDILQQGTKISAERSLYIRFRQDPLIGEYDYIRLGYNDIWTAINSAFYVANVDNSDGDIALVPIETANITFDNNDGTGTGTTKQWYTKVPLQHDMALYTASAPTVTRTGYTFAGWNTKADGTGTTFISNSSEDFSVTGDTTLYAQWTPITHTITWKNDDGSVIDTTTVAYGSTPTHADPIKANTAEYSYTFAGWNPALSEVTGPATYTATYSSTPNSYTVTFVPNGGSATPSSTTVTFGGTYGTLPTPTRPHYSFNGWFTAASGGNQVTSTTQVTATSDHSIYAQWTPIFHPICGASCSHDGDHVNVEWTEIVKGTNLIQLGAYSYCYELDTQQTHYYLSGDLSLPAPAGYNSNYPLRITQDTYLCLGGYSLSGSVVVDEGATLYLCDCKGTGKISNGDGRGVTVKSGRFVMYSGSIANCVTPFNTHGAGVYVGSGGSFDMYGGTIKYCSTENDIRYPSSGGGVYVTGTGVFNMNDGVIKNCAANRGGGVAAADGGTFNMNGGTIQDCSIGSYHNSRGGGVYITENGNFTMNSGSITGCSASQGGGVYADSTAGSFTLAGGSITGCSSSDHTYYGAVYLNDTNMTVSGNVTIKGTQSGDLVIYKRPNAKGVITFTENGQLAENIRIYIEPAWGNKWSTKEDTRFINATSDTQRNTLKSQITLYVDNAGIKTGKVYTYGETDLRFAESNRIYVNRNNSSWGTVTLTQGSASPVTSGDCFETITVTVEPATDYRLVSLTATMNYDSAEITLVPDPESENVFTFEMPAETAHIYATFDLMQVELDTDEVRIKLGSLNLSAPIGSVKFATELPEGYTNVDSVNYATTATEEDGEIYIASKVTDGVRDVVIYSDRSILMTGDRNGLFTNLSKLTAVDFGNIEMTDLNVSDMFVGCAELRQIKTSSTAMTNVDMPLLPYRFGASAGATSITNLSDASASQTLGRRYTITYAPAYGTEGKPVSYYYGYGVTLPDTLSRTGYTFDGLFGDAEMTQAVSSVSTTDNGDKTIYVKWTPIEYTISYTLDGGELPAEAPNAYTIEYDAITLINPTRTGYTFTGWTGTDLDAQTMNVTIAAGSVENREFTAHWQANSYTVAFNANGGEGTMDAQSFTYDEAVKQLTANAFTRTGFSFVGWASSANGTVEYMDEEYVQNMAAEDGSTVNLYAVWSKNPIVGGTITGTDDTVTSVVLLDLKGNTYEALFAASGDDYVYSVCAPAGTYQLIVRATVGGNEVTVTDLIELAGDAEHPVAIPTAKMNSSIVEIVDDAPKAIVDGLEAIALADSGNGVEIKLTVTAEESSSSDAEQSAIRTEARGKTLQFVDLTLTKNGSDIGSGNAQLLTIVIPFEKGNKQNITVYRYHIDSAEEMTEDPEPDCEGFVVGPDSITIYAEKFSTYAIGYTVPYSPATHSVVVENAVNGTIKADPSYAASGSTVAITVTPDKGYVLDKLTVTDIFGREVDVAEKDGKYTFKMPAANVTVKATFKEEVAFQNPFEDVFATDYYYDAVLWAVKAGIANGTSATTFSPNAPCTRAQMVTFLWRAAGCPEPSRAVCDFTDVNMDSYYGKAVLWAIENGITKGTSDTTFSPDMECSRAQMATFLCRMAGGKAESDTVAFTDVKADTYYAESVQWAVENGITNGTGDNKFSPDATCTRGQMVTFLYRYYVK